MGLITRNASVWVLGSLALAACAEGPAGPAAPEQPSFASAAAVAGLARGEAWLCKVGTAASFDLSGGATGTVSLADGECQLVLTGTLAPPASVTITEQSDPNIVLDSILVIRGQAPTAQSFPQNTDTTRVTGSSTATGVAGKEWGSVVIFYNHPAPPPPPGGEGCTPGYWKQSHHFDSWVGYTPGQSFEAVFGRDVPGTPTLLNALSTGGGGLNALMRHTTAALLNSKAVSYGMTTAQVIAAFQAAFDSGNYTAQKDAFEALNESGCPLN